MNHSPAAIYVSILNNKITSNIPSLVPPAAVQAGLPQTSLPSLFEAIGSGNPAAMATVPGITPSIMAAVGQALTTAYVKSYRVVFLVSIAFSVWAIVSACMLRKFGTENTGNHVHIKPANESLLHQRHKGSQVDGRGESAEKV